MNTVRFSLFTLFALCASICQAQTCINGQCRLQPTLVSQPITRVVQPVVRMAAQPVMRVVEPATRAVLHAVGGGQQFAHCLREAQLQAQRRRPGHITGVAPGAGMQGVGMTTNLNSPAHCRGRGQLLARACVVGPDGRMYCSAAYSR